jgi:flavodoxin
VEVCEKALNYALLWVYITINLNYPTTFSGKLPFIPTFNDNCETVYDMFGKLIYVSVMGKNCRKSKLANGI